ncbi:MAG: hypothetical protein ABI587_17275 [Gemmatimonadales bacterium]
MSYTICPSCGQKALSVATRCPRCGVAFEDQFLSRARSAPRPRRTPLVFLIAGVVVALLGANALMQRLSTGPQGMSPPPPRATAVRPTPPVEPRPAPRHEAPSASLESLGTAPPAQVTIDSPAPAPHVVESAAPTVAAAPTRTVATRRRYASTWMNVRADRSTTAPVLRILRPGEAVEVDSLARGWYRVWSDRLPIGYVDRRLLHDAPSPTSP